LQRISEHVYWMSPAAPDRPSLCAVVGSRWTLMLDAGSSAAHARLFLDELEGEGAASPSLVLLTHSHWDHVFGAAELGVPVVAHARTAAYLTDLAKLDWSDEALEQRLAVGEVSEFHVTNVKEELPSPREVRVAPVDIVFTDTLAFDLGDVSVRVQHIANDHTDDGSAAFVEPDRVLFVGDATCDSTSGRLTADLALPLYDELLALGAEHVVEGHNEVVMSRADFDEFAEKVRRAAALVDRLGPDEPAVLAEFGEAPDEDTTAVVRAFIHGHS
jgi:glyoxylase-like metal-dependent hydrolase (beta-lactamase superfamily II)